MILDSSRHRYQLNNGTVYNGSTFEFLNSVRLLIDANGFVYWTEFTPYELNSTKPFQKAVLPGE